MYDVAVVGAGPIGSYTAYQLADRGFDVLLLEEDAEVGEDVICTDVIGTEAFERFDLPFRRAAVSVAANIAEGASRRTKMDYCHFLYIARGSLAEVGYYIHLSGRLDFIDDNECATLGKLQQETAATLYGLISCR